MNDSNLPQVAELQDLIAKSGLSADTGAMIYKEFAPIASSVAELAAKAHSLVVTDATQLTEMKQAREVRLALVKARKEAERKKTELKEDSNRYGKTVQSAYNTLDVISKTAEAHAEQQEKFAQIQEEKRQAEIRAARQDELAQYQAFLPPMGDLGTMTAEEFAVVVDMAKAQKQKREEQEAQEKAEAEAKAEAERLERERLKLAAEEAEAKRKEAEAALAKERAERERIEAEAQEKEREAQRQAEAALAAPDKEKLNAFESFVRNYEMPSMTTEAGKAAAGRAKMFLTKIADDVKTQIAGW
jgi:DNA repair exonuclease SbcCD ATPase subunit